MKDIQLYYPVLDQYTQIQELACIQVKAKEILKQPYMQCAGFPLLTKGALRITQILENGEESFLYDLKPGDYCHEVMNCLIKQNSGNIKSMALVDSTIYLVSPAFFQNVLMKDAAFLLAVYSDAITKMHKLMANNQLKNESVEERLLGYLISQTTSRIYVTHKDIAFELHSAREVISRKLKEYEQYGWVVLGKGKIEIIDILALEKEYRKVKR
ncbi:MULTISPECIES: Crp/Fnr family transcriptional regulator [Bacillota]|jgi:CRP/FNR family transcriptional regulator, anaerobic regulatory protein|uniref:Crp/Fnr family transcriptional regulator n=1 Tax=Amedibacillus hominis TaxID=2897776 RepID=A0ABS9R5I5_9FIRM|nr:MULTISPECIES: Crp/Fnr family transcriptional regulator [Bacillota]MCH4284915.1 Crp/Fnr family transcriptional regulator [Amedibacillus hominis]RGB55134.1 Crp/Fnr family transcriptional regulator [Absiella sp. AM22-9]RGB62723.1 Crp/Fnr family transcriptional regulator [Absiella sp. AM10-20]RGB69461.1 Crp/Fnr family transcriptional regulator [Absiella sp. AM09-45]RGB77770.1 Crp/Fnr family transcriptional regulator [Absiella sp. AM09-50]